MSEEVGVGGLFLTTYLKETSLDDEDTPFTTAPPCRRKTRKRMESLHLLYYDNRA